MVALYASRPSVWAEITRMTLLAHHIPAILIGPWYGYTDVISRVPFVMVDEIYGEMSDSVAARIAPKRLYPAPDAELYSLIRETYLRLRGEDMETVHVCGIRFYEDMILFRGEIIELTPAEQRILHLLLFCRDMRFTAEEIGLFCLNTPSAKAAAVHISRMNQKSSALTRRNMIVCTRGKGYALWYEPPQPDFMKGLSGDWVWLS